MSYVRLQEKILVASYAEYGLKAGILKGKTGVWIPGKLEKKIAAIGVRISKGVTMHGFSANIYNDLSQFKHIIPCGMPDLKSTSLKIELSVNINLIDFSKTVIENYFKEIGSTNIIIRSGVNS